MEDAYNELFREFVHLRSICIRQAALLQKLSRELHKQQVSNGYLDQDGSFSGLASIPGQGSQESTAHSQEDSIPPLVATNQNAAPHTDVGHTRTAGAAPFSVLLAEDMGKLGLNVPHHRQTHTEEQEEGEHPQPASPASRSPALSSSGSYQGHQSGGSKAMQPYGTASPLAWAYNPLLGSEELSNSGGEFMSEMELQSQVCEFCHAIFPGHTATRGEFLRHLHTHIT
ncbi:uncharacterized protein zgc:113184 [Gadus chalcogrammus]|uniref:uncharacterized protein zgc:113184 n=1 Tax=Gadus chalcogrammus TaxID=1042646 RepID=UPI0024C4B56D|nr:uncharacterized protein zgc:113184 [Gadus chalcogrammus]XP_056461189.1 uncharacterized protein zgc:113184 [Gadus chalcogrammus]XP_056461190.1 uncharacterized protein zgc:113184 [Gadus chalcogrammus]